MRIKLFSIALFGTVLCFSSLAGTNSSSTNFLVGKKEAADSSIVLYLRGTMNSWNAEDNYKLAISEGTVSFDRYIRNVSLTANAELKIATSDWTTWQYGYTNLTDFSKSYCGSVENSTNIKITEAGLYDIYVNTSTNYVEIAKSAQELFQRQDLNYTRSTQTNLNADGFSKIIAVNHFSSFTQLRTTYFINNGLYMHDGTTGTNSGYYTRKNENSGNNMYHYQIEGGYSNMSTGSIINERHDSTINTNDFFINGHYYHENASTIYTNYQYDMNNHNYYSTDATMIQNAMYFTAPLFCNPEFIVVTGEAARTVNFTGAGLKDIKDGKTEHYLYTSDTSLLSDGANTVFSKATIANAGDTVISANLQAKIDQ
jgi:hypothetical protein